MYQEPSCPASKGRSGSEAGRTLREQCRPVKGQAWRPQHVDRSALECCLDDYYLLLLALASCCSALVGVLRYRDPTLLPPATAALAHAGRFGARLRRRCFGRCFVDIAALHSCLATPSPVNDMLHNMPSFWFAYCTWACQRFKCGCSILAAVTV